MTREELLRKLEELEEREFYINMSDRWTEEDRRLLNNIAKEKRTVRHMLNANA